MENISEFCAEGSSFENDFVTVAENVTLRVITFTPPKNDNNPAVVFVAGWISLMAGWKEVLREMTKDFKVYYIETREKISAKVSRKANYSVEAIGSDIVAFISQLNFKNRSYILLGSSLGATAVLDCCRFLKQDPLCLVLIGPNAVFRVPRLGMFIIRIFYPGFYLILKPVIKWYLRNFRLDLKSDFVQYQKYCHALDAADPWKLKKAVIPFSKYEVWNLLNDIQYPTLIIGASKDVLHEPENLYKMTRMMKNASYIDMQTNKHTHSPGVVEEMRKFIKNF